MNTDPYLVLVPAGIRTLDQPLRYPRVVVILINMFSYLKIRKHSIAIFTFRLKKKKNLHCIVSKMP